MTGKRVLIIEDDTAIAELQRDYLEASGFAVDIESRGDAGLRRAAEGRYNLVILDVMLPGLTGFEVCRELRAHSDIPILLVSARREDIDKIRGLGLGADDYITKPFSPAELVARVKAHLIRYERLTGGTEDAPVVVRELEINPAARQAIVRGEVVPLTAREFEILLLMASYPDRVFTREEIFDRLWGAERYGDVSTVTVHVRRIREKIEHNPSDPVYIETVRGFGYRLRG